MRARQRHDAGETPSRAFARSSAKIGEKRLPARLWTHARHRPFHRQNEIFAGVDSIASENLEDNAKRHAGSIGSTQVVALEPVRVTPPDCIVWTCVGSTARKRHLDECGKLSFVYCQSTTTRCHGFEFD